MRLTTNNKLIQQRGTLARYFTFGGLGLLIASFVMTLTQGYLALAYATLFVGFVLAYIGALLMNKWVKPPRADQVLEKALKGFDNKHHLYNYLLPAEHLLLMPTGILVLRTKPHDGQIICQNGKWSRPWKWSRLFGGMGQEPLGDPIAELKVEMQKIRQWLTDKIEPAATVPIDGYVIFTDPRALLSLDDPSLPVLMANNLKDTLRKNKRGPALPPKLVGDLERVLNEKANAKATQ